MDMYPYAHLGSLEKHITVASVFLWTLLRKQYYTYDSSHTTLSDIAAEALVAVSDPIPAIQYRKTAHTRIYYGGTVVIPLPSGTFFSACVCTVQLGQQPHLLGYFDFGAGFFVGSSEDVTIKCSSHGLVIFDTPACEESA